MLDNLPFMPEECCSCGRTLSVGNRADKAWGGYRWGVRRMTDVVHRSSVRCDGAEHGGCQAACLIYWKEAWLERIEPGSAREVTTAPSPDEEAFITTTLLRATTNGHPPSWDHQASGHARNWGIAKLLRSLSFEAFNRLQHLNRRFLPRLLLFKKGRAHPFISIYAHRREVWLERLCSALTRSACRPRRAGLL
jgi:hypothetical protein